MKIEKAESRDKERHKRKNGMRISNRSIFTLVQVWTGKKKKKGKNNG